MTRRSLAQRLARHLQDVIPPNRRDWALGMAAELDHIEDDGAALAFAVGAVWAGYRQGARLWSNWLRLGRWSAALGSATLGLAVMTFTAWLQFLPESSRPTAAFTALLTVLAFCYLGAALGFARRDPRLVLRIASAALALLVTAAFTLADLGEAIRLYVAMVQGESAPRSAFYGALLLESYVFVLSIAAAGVFFWRFEGRRAPA